MDADQLAETITRGRRLVALAYVAVATVVLVLAIDYQLKGQILREALKARTALDELRAATLAVSNGRQPARRATAAGDGRTGSGAGGNAGDGVADDGAAGAVLDKASRRRNHPAGRRAAGPAGGAGGDG